MRNLIIFGDTPFAERLYKYITIEGKDKVIAFTQEKNFITQSELQGIPVLRFEDLKTLVDVEFEIILGIGYTKMNQLKEKLYSLCIVNDYIVATYISTNAFVYTDEIGAGSFVAPGTNVGPGCKLGIGNYLASAVVLSHDNNIGNFNFFSSNAVFGGFAKVGNNCFFGLHCTVKDNIVIADNNLIGSSANLLKSIHQNNGVYVGNPARALIEKDSMNTNI